MYPLLRLAWHCLRAARRPRGGFADEYRLGLRIWPQDLDVNLHVNNGRYLTLMDLGRFDLMVRTGLLGRALAEGWYPVVGDATITFRASLGAFQAFDLATQVIAWDQKWIFIQQSFWVGERLFAQGVIRGQIRCRRTGAVPPPALLARLGQPDVPSPPLPPHLAAWVEGLELARRAEATP